MSGRLTLQPLEPDLDDLSYEYFDILREAVQPDSAIPIERAVQQLLNVLANCNYSSNEVSYFLETCYEAAEQIPYNHNSQSKLVTLVDLVLNSESIAKPIDEAFGVVNCQGRYQMLGQTLSDHWNSSKPSNGGPSVYVNFQSFAARIHERGMLSGIRMAKLTCEDALGNPEDVDSSEREAYVMAACQWILIFGAQVYHDVLARPKPLSPTRKQWRRWREELQKAASNGRSGTYAGLRDEASLLAGRAAEEMRAIEIKMGSGLVRKERRCVIF